MSYISGGLFLFYICPRPSSPLVARRHEFRAWPFPVQHSSPIPSICDIRSPLPWCSIHAAHCLSCSSDTALPGLRRLSAMQAQQDQVRRQPPLHALPAARLRTSMPGVQRAEAPARAFRCVNDGGEEQRKRSAGDGWPSDEATVVRGVPAEEGPVQHGEALLEVRGERGPGVQRLPGERCSYAGGVDADVP